MKKVFKKLVFFLVLITLFSYCFELYKRNQFTSYIETDDFFELDSISGHHHKSNAQKELVWAEHPEGKLRLTTNNLGFRNNGDFKRTKTQPVLFTGDSHTDGLVNNKENFIHLLSLQTDSTQQLLNAGHGFYSFKNYLGILKKHLNLKPKQFVITVYSGNDFIENLLYESENTSITGFWRFSYYRLKKKVLYYTDGLESSQHLNQAIFFSLFPNQIENSINISKNYLTEIKTICKQNNIKLKILILPSELDIEDELRKSVDVKYLEVNDKIRNEFLKLLNEMGLSYYDPNYLFKLSKKDLYWDLDSHLNIEGHKLVSEIINDFVNN